MSGGGRSRRRATSWRGARSSGWVASGSGWWGDERLLRGFGPSMVRGRDDRACLGVRCDELGGDADHRPLLLPGGRRAWERHHAGDLVMSDIVGRLLDEAEKAQRKGHLLLAEVCRDASDQLGLITEERDRLRAERDRLREALQDMLADREAWQIGRDTRDRARAALKEVDHD